MEGEGGHQEGKGKVSRSGKDGVFLGFATEEESTLQALRKHPHLFCSCRLPCCLPPSASMEADGPYPAAALCRGGWPCVALGAAGWKVLFNALCRRGASETISAFLPYA